MQPPDTYDWAFKLIIGLEGGYINNPQDPGGETKYGISKAAYPHLNIKTLTLKDAKRIYRQDYWNAMRCDQMTRRLSILVFDAAVQHGTGKAAEWLADPLEFDTYLARRLAYYASLQGFKTFGEGWMNRISKLLIVLAEQPDSVDSVVFNGLSSAQLMRVVLHHRLDGGFLWRERPTADGTGGKIDLRPA